MAGKLERGVPQRGSTGLSSYRRQFSLPSGLFQKPTLLVIIYEAVVKDFFRFSSDARAAFADEFRCVDFLARMNHLFARGSLLSLVTNNGFDRTFDGSSGAQKRTVSDKYLCASLRLLSTTEP